MTLFDYLHLWLALNATAALVIVTGALWYEVREWLQ